MEEVLSDTAAVVHVRALLVRSYLHFHHKGDAELLWRLAKVSTGYCRGTQGYKIHAPVYSKLHMLCSFFPVLLSSTPLSEVSGTDGWTVYCSYSLAGGSPRPANILMDLRALYQACSLLCSKILTVPQKLGYGAHQRSLQLYF